MIVRALCNIACPEYVISQGDIVVVPRAIADKLLAGGRFLSADSAGRPKFGPAVERVTDRALMAKAKKLPKTPDPLDGKDEYDDEDDDEDFIEDGE